MAEDNGSSCADLVKCAKRTRYDATTRRLIFVLQDQAAATAWYSKLIFHRGTQLRHLCPATLKLEDLPANTSTALPIGQDLLQYQVRVLVHDFSANAVQAVLS